MIEYMTIRNLSQATQILHQCGHKSPDRLGVRDMCATTAFDRPEALLAPACSLARGDRAVLGGGCGITEPGRADDAYAAGLRIGEVCRLKAASITANACLSTSKVARIRDARR